jgi:nitroimidazol reductase NimA-like FMN-containing flavoprotein (pyridoxamine 5'-phosphate oxidase superfamily)
MDLLTPTSRTRVVRHAERAVYDRDQIYSILDEGFICHIGFTADAQTYVIPTAYGRSGDQLYLHGAAANRMLRSLAQGLDVLRDYHVSGRLRHGAKRHSVNRSITAP